MDILLTDLEVRILGCLLEKQMATPDLYPLSLNALTNAVNQKSNRNPVVSHDEDTVSAGLELLKEKRLVWESVSGRVPKYEETFLNDRNLVNKEAAALCILLLRGPQTPGEIRTRTNRLYAFEDLNAVEETLRSMEEYGLVKKLALRPGFKEARYVHLLAGEPPEEDQAQAAGQAQAIITRDNRLDALEEEVADLRQELDTLQKAFIKFKGQFE